MRQNRKEPNDGDRQVFSVSVALSERGAVHEQNRNCNSNVKGQAQRKGMQETIEFSQNCVRAMAGFDLSQKVKAMHRPRPERQVCYQRAAAIGVAHTASGLDGGCAEINGEYQTEEMTGDGPAKLGRRSNACAHGNGSNGNGLLRSL